MPIDMWLGLKVNIRSLLPMMAKGVMSMATVMRSAWQLMLQRNLLLKHLSMVSTPPSTLRR